MEYKTKTNPIMDAVPQFRQTVAGFPRRRPEFNPRSSDVGVVVDKVALGQSSSEYFGYYQPILIPPNAPVSSIIRDSYNRPISGRSNQMDLVSPHHHGIKKE
jgi:hypothetical protein